ncbi:MAG TPA: phage/plasmid primase, P4 family, partial [Ruminococcus sp.]|nr:phage/plasmid primase, P4 family [Ruminococcus sp.]
NIPDVLKQTASFCVWKLEKRSGRPTKVPYNPRTGAMARTNDPSTFADFNTAMKSYAIGGWDGIGYRVSEGIGAIDIDHCIREDGSLNDVAASILGIFPDAYFERSPSGTGLRGFFRLSPDFAYDKTVYYINNRKHGLEVYLPGVTNRFVTVTGDMFRPGTVERDDDALKTALDTFMKRGTRAASAFKGNPVSYFTDEQVIKHASESKSGDKFKALYDGRWEEGYDSQSDADMAFVSMLCFWCGCVEEQIDRIFRSSGLMRDKWDRRTGDATYGEITIRNAVSSCSEIYRPVSGLPDEDDVLLDFTDLDASTIQEERDRREREGYTFTPDYRFLSTTVDELSPHTNPRYESFQIGNGRMFVDFFRSIILMNDTRGRWYIYDGRVWRPDQHDIKIAEMAKDFRDTLLAFVPRITSEDTRKRFLERVQKLDQRKYRDLMVKDAASDPAVTVDMSAFDRDKFLFNCHNGTINLLTGEFKAHDPADMLTKMTEVDYVPDAVCDRWLSFMDEVMEGDKGRIRYLQKAIGYAMSGDTRLECMFILYGATSRNGKGTTMETILRILGEYGRTAKPDMLSKKGFADSSGPSEDVARLNGARMVNVSEPEKSMQIDASLTKQMTGNNILTARFLRENSFEFKPQFKLFIDTNHLPQISDMTLFESDRIKIIPFNRHFTAEERDIDLKSFFARSENLSGILNWCLEGFRLYMTEGLDMPDSVENATKEYRQQSDRIMMFTSQCVKKEIGQELRAQAVYSRYKDWCAENGFKYENAANFRKKMEQAGFVYQRRRPRDEEGACTTTMVNDIIWVVGEEPEDDFVPISETE